MDAVTVIEDAINRVGGAARRAVADLEVDALTWRPDDGANSIAWLVWHLARVQDDHVAEVAGSEQVWVQDGGFAERVGLPADTLDTGFGHGPDDVAAVQPDGPDVLVEYLDAVTARTHQYLSEVTAEDLDRVVDDAWDPPVTLGVRLVSVIGDGLQHAGQAAYVRGMWERR